MELALLIGQILLKYGPTVAASFQSIASKKDLPTQAEWDGFFELTRKSGASYFDNPQPIGGLIPPPKVG